MFLQPGNSQTPITRVGLGFALLSVATLTGCVQVGPKPVERTTPTPLPEPTRNTLPTPEPTPTYEDVPLAENCTPLRLPENNYEVCASVIKDPNNPGKDLKVIGTLRSTDTRSLNRGDIVADTTLQAYPLTTKKSPVVSRDTSNASVYSESFAYELACPDDTFAGSDRWAPAVNFEITPDSGLGVRILAKADPTDVSFLCDSLAPTNAPTPSYSPSPRATAQSAGLSL